MFFLWKEKLYKWLLFALLLAALLATLFCIIAPFLLLWFDFSTYSSILSASSVIEAYIPYQASIFALVFSIVALVGWFLTAGSRPIGPKLLLAPSIIMLVWDGFLILLSVVSLITGTEVTFTEVVLPTLFRIVFHSGILCLYRLWQV